MVNLHLHLGRVTYDFLAALVLLLIGVFTFANASPDPILLTCQNYYCKQESCWIVFEKKGFSKCYVIYADVGKKELSTCCAPVPNLAKCFGNVFASQDDDYSGNNCCAPTNPKVTVNRFEAVCNHACDVIVDEVNNQYVAKGCMVDPFGLGVVIDQGKCEVVTSPAP